MKNLESNKIMWYKFQKLSTILTMIYIFHKVKWDELEYNIIVKLK